MAHERSRTPSSAGSSRSCCSPSLLAGARRGGDGLPRARRRDGGGECRRALGRHRGDPRHAPRGPPRSVFLVVPSDGGGRGFLAAVVVVAFLAVGIYGVAFGTVGASLAASLDRDRGHGRGADDGRIAADAPRADDTDGIAR